MTSSNKISVKRDFYARAKLLLTGEYAVLYGAKAIGLPLKTGQKMMVRNARGSDLIWEALDENGEVWFESQLSLYDFSAVKTSDPEISKKLQKLLKSAARLNSEFLSTWSGFKVETQLEFPLPGRTARTPRAGTRFRPPIRHSRPAPRHRGRRQR